MGRNVLHLPCPFLPLPALPALFCPFLPTVPMQMLMLRWHVELMIELNSKKELHCHHVSFCITHYNLLMLMDCSMETIEMFI